MIEFDRDVTEINRSDHEQKKKEKKASKIHIKIFREESSILGKQRIIFPKIGIFIGMHQTRTCNSTNGSFQIEEKKTL